MYGRIREKSAKGAREVQYVYGCGVEGKVLCEGLVEQLTDSSDSFCDLAIFRRKLSESEESVNKLTYLGRIED